jgi:GDSL-like Lipase/Acylhydrolase family
MSKAGRRLTVTGFLVLLGTAAAHQSTYHRDPELERSLGAEIDAYVAADKVSPPAPCEVLFVGSSSIVKWKPTLVADMAPLPVINRGFGSSHMEYVNRWFEQIVAPYHPRAIVLYDGENDLNAGKPAAQVVADFDSFMQLKTAKLKDTPVYFISVKPSKDRIDQLPQQSVVNAAVRERVAKRSDLHYIDVVPAMLENGRPKDIYEADGLHMTREGYLLWIKIVRAAILPPTEEQLRSCRARWTAP